MMDAAHCRAVPLNSQHYKDRDGERDRKKERKERGTKKGERKEGKENTEGATEV